MLKVRQLLISYFVITTCVSSALSQTEPAGEDANFTLARVIPNDVFVFVASRDNPARAFLDEYWDEVFQSLKESGLDRSVAELFGAMIGADEERDEQISRLKERFPELLAGVDWQQLKRADNAFAERLTPLDIGKRRAVVVTASVVWLSRGGDGTRENYEGLVEILETIAAETNVASGSQALEVKRETRKGTEIATLNLLATVAGAPKLPLSVGLRDDTLILALREDLFDDVLDLMDGDSSKQPLSEDARFQSAFDQLPTATDCMTFFDMQALMGPMLDTFQVVFDSVVKPGDHYDNTGMNKEASKLNGEALFAYRRGEIAKALKLVQQAHKIEPKDSIIRYNLACFSALAGKKKEALDWLEKAVEGGFYAPRKIAVDNDLKGLRAEPRYKQALEKAAVLAAERRAEDVTINFDREGEARRLREQAAKAYMNKDLDQAMEFVEQALEVAPHDSLVLYDMGCLHTLQGHTDKGLDFLQQAVQSGCYCPNRISKDRDWDSVRDDPRYKRALVMAQKMAAESNTGNRESKTRLVRRLVERMGEAAATMDYAATVEFTDGHSVRTESVTVLVADAQEKPIYPVFGRRQSLTDFARYLPEETKAFSVSGGADLPELYAFFEETLREGGPLGKEILATLDQIQQQIGWNLKADVIDLLQGDSISMTLEDGSSVCLMKVSDEQKAYEKLDEAMTLLPQMITQAIANKPQLGAITAFVIRSSPLEHEELGGFQSVNVAMSPQPIAVWGTADGFLIVGSSAKAVSLCLATSKGEHPNIENNATVMSEAIMPDGPFVSVSLSNRRGTAKEIATAMGTASMMGGMVAASMSKPEVRPVVNKMIGILGKLAPVIRKVDFYKSYAATTTFDGKMWRASSVTHYQDPAERASVDQADDTGADEED